MIAKKLLFVLALNLVCMCSVFSFSSSRRVQDAPMQNAPEQEGQKISVTGFVHAYGNAPMTWLGIETEDEKAYGLRVDEKMSVQLRELFGVRVSIEGTLELPVQYGFEQLKDGAIHVEKIEVIQQSEQLSQIDLLGTEISVTGFVQIYGNEPVTQVGFVDDSGKEYTLSATDEVLVSLRDNQGRKLVIAGKHIPAEEPRGFKQLKDGTIYVSNFMLYSEN